MSEQTCPHCGKRVPEPGITSELAMGGVRTPVPQDATCSECGTKLVREAESPDLERRRWHVAIDESDRKS
jgi:hypothetical protein